MIGNGFDMAHELPTEYSDFLGFCKMLYEVYNVYQNGNPEDIWTNLNIKLRWEHNTQRLKMKFVELYSCSRVDDSTECAMERIVTNTIWDELYGFVENNIWISYFLRNPMYQKENWIDFESEISNVIQCMDEISKQVPTPTMTIIDKKYHKTFHDLFEEGTDFLKLVGTKEEFEKCVVKLIDDLNRLTRALEIYLCEWVEPQKIKVKSPDISRLSIHYVISLNYTNTYAKLYNIAKAKGDVEDEPFDFVHGEAKITNTVENNNMVLGIDEYLPIDKRDIETKFISFKKYYQRIFKGTGCRYKNWVDSIISSRFENEMALRERFPKQIPYEQFNRKHKLYIFGHSLDVTDKDLLQDLILNDNVYTTIFYHSKKELGKKIANLVKVIGQEELIRRTGGSTKTIEFVLQKDMVAR